MVIVKLPVCLPNRWATLKDRRRAYKQTLPTEILRRNNRCNVPWAVQAVLECRWNMFGAAKGNLLPDIASALA
jgi:hypothetical protein